MKNYNQLIERLISGDITIINTDIGYEYVCDATNESSVLNLISKNATDLSTFSILIPTLDDLMRYIRELPEVAESIFELSDKPINLILPNPSGVTKHLIFQNKTSFRVVKHDTVCQILKQLRRPMLAIPTTAKPGTGLLNKTNINHNGYDIFDIDSDISSTGELPSVIDLGLNGEVNIIRK